MFLVFNLLFQQNSSRALQTSPCIFTAGPTTPTLKSQKTVLPNPLHQIHKKTFSAHFQIDSENGKQPANDTVSWEEKNLYITGTWVPASQMTFSSASCNAAASEMHCWESRASNNLSAEPW